jgi:hypothetical protein
MEVQNNGTYLPLQNMQKKVRGRSATLTCTDNEHFVERYAVKVCNLIIVFDFIGCVSVRQVKTARSEN